MQGLQIQQEQNTMQTILLLTDNKLFALPRQKKSVRKTATSQVKNNHLKLKSTPKFLTQSLNSSTSNSKNKRIKSSVPSVLN